MNTNSIPSEIFNTISNEVSIKVKEILGEDLINMVFVKVNNSRGIKCLVSSKVMNDEYFSDFFDLVNDFSDKYSDMFLDLFTGGESYEQCRN